MRDANTRERISEALGIASEMNPQDTDGTWLEDLTIQVGPYIKEWDIDQCYPWSEWPGREDHFPKSNQSKTLAIDAVAVRSGDGEYVAIQCKATEVGRADGRRQSHSERAKSTPLRSNFGRLSCGRNVGS